MDDIASYFTDEEWENETNSDFDDDPNNSDCEDNDIIGVKEGRDDEGDDEEAEEERHGASLHRSQTTMFRERLDANTQSLSARVRNVLEFMEAQGLNLPLFLDAVSWGEEECRADAKIRYARTALMVSEELPEILKRWYNPRHGQTKKTSGKTARSAKGVLDNFAFSVVNQTFEDEVKRSATLFLSPAKDLSEDQFLSFDFQRFKVQIKERAPRLWNTLRSMVYSEAQSRRNKTKDPDMVILNIISQAQYSRSHQRGRVAKIWAIYLKACGTASRAFDAMHSIGVVMSHKWTTEAYASLSQSALATVQEKVKDLDTLWIPVHDNVNLPMRVFSQRLHNQSHFISGCASSIWILPPHASLPPDINHKLQLHRAENFRETFDFNEVLYSNTDISNDLHLRTVHRILRAVLDSPEFLTYGYKDDPLFSAPPPVHQLPAGKENAPTLYMLGTTTDEETSYEGNLKAVQNVFEQLRLDTDEEQIKTGTKRVLVWVGDQLTVGRLRGLFKLRHEDHNSLDRLDFLIPMFGWFHLLMAFANSLHSQFLGTPGGIGNLRQGFESVGRKNLLSSSIKGPFWHHLDEAIHHFSEAHFRAAWLSLCNLTSISDLLQFKPPQLLKLAEEIAEKYASRLALETHANESKEMQDEVYRQSILWNISVVPYLELRHAIKTGDVGLMENLLPTLLFRFAGSGQSNYATEMMELQQGMKREWPKELCNHIRRWCWLINNSGEPDGFLPIDLAQEHNIADIKANYRSMGPGASMEYLHKISPAIPTLRRIQRHTERQTKASARGSRHGAPSAAADIYKLTNEYMNSSLYTLKPGRKVKLTADRAQDVVTEGTRNLINPSSHTMSDWFKRRTFLRSRVEIWKAQTNINNEVTNRSEEGRTEEL